MYHRVGLAGDALTVTPAQLAAQLRWLAAEGFQFVTAASILRRALPRWPVLITFDDAYRDTFELARPVLCECEVPAVVFVPTAFLGKSNMWDSGAVPLMTADQLATMAAEGFEVGLHSHTHRDFAALTAGQIVADVRANFAALHALGLAPTPVLAYPYGRRPSGATGEAMRAALRECGVEAAFRIGNRVNRVPPENYLEINRLGVRGDASFDVFRRKVFWGRLLS